VDTESLAKKLLGMIERSGVDEGEVYVQTTSGLEMVLRDQAVERLRNKVSGGFSLRLIKDKRMGFVHSSDVRDEALGRAVEQGIQLAEAAAADEFNTLVEGGEAGVDVQTYDEGIDDITFERKLSVLKDIETLCFAYDPAVSMMEALSYEDSKTETVVANTGGVFRQARSTLFSVSASVVAERDGDVETGGEWSEARFFEDLDPPSRIASRACWKATSLLGGKAVPTQTVPVIFDRDAGFAPLTHFFAMVNGNNVADGTSMLEGRIGETIASALVTIVDDPTVDRAVGSRVFDDEGTACARTVIVDGGILKAFLFDCRAGKKAGFASTGNARRDGFRQLPSVGRTNLLIERGDTPAEDIIASTGTGLWVLSLAGWWVGINPSTGGFSSGAKGLWVVDGEVVHPVKNVTIASNTLDMLAGIDAVGNDLFMRHETSSPTLRIGEMRLGGI
jgi:PmbA protein